MYFVVLRPPAVTLLFPPRIGLDRFADPVRLPRAVDLKAALKAGRESKLWARVGAPVAVLVAVKAPGGQGGWAAGGGTAQGRAD